MQKLLVLLLLVLISCGSEKEDSPATGNSYSYQYNENGCDTEKQTFSTEEDLCKALKDDEKNKYCASFSRELAYDNKNCPSLIGQSFL